MLHTYSIHHTVINVFDCLNRSEQRTNEREKGGLRLPTTWSFVRSSLATVTFLDCEFLFTLVCDTHTRTFPCRSTLKNSMPKVSSVREFDFNCGGSHKLC